MKFRYSQPPLVTTLSLPVRGAWVEMQKCALYVSKTRRRSPCGERGLKCESRWQDALAMCRSPCGERGLKCWRRRFRPPPPAGRSPCGERGLKYWRRTSSDATADVAPRAGSVG